MTQVERSSKRVALTFDDGPNPPYTNEIAEILRKENVPATFFLCGMNIDKYGSEATLLAQQGFRIGNHSYEHNFCLTSLGLDYDGIIKTQKLIEDHAGAGNPKIFRAPFGATSPFTLRRLRDEVGFLIAPVRRAIMADRRGKFTTSEIVNRATTNLRDGTVLLLHDGDGIAGMKDLSPTVEAVARIISNIQAQGYQIVDLLELIEEKKVPIFYP